MTCVVGLVSRGRVHIAGDGRLSNGERYSESAIPKVWRHRDGWVAGFSADWRLGTRLRANLRLSPPPLRDADVDRWAVTEIHDAIMVALGGESGETPDDNDEPTDGVQVLVGIRGRLYVCGPVSGVMRSADAVAAIGEGAAVAEAVTEATKGPPQKRLESALASVAARYLAVGPPWSYVHT